MALLMQLQLRWENAFLKIGYLFQDDINAPGMVTKCLLHLWRFTTWSASRWCSEGPSCQCLIASMFTGLASLVGRILADPSKSKYYIGGFGQFSANILRLCAVTAVSSVASERALRSNLHDDRIAKRLDHLDEVVQTDTES